MSIKPNEEYEKERNRQVSGMRSALDYAMGVLIILVGLFIMFRFKFDIDLNKKFPPDVYDKVYGSIFIIYGCWRLYRGYKKNYFR